jgi:nicotinate-nucleotide adenylyltransferase
MKIGILGGAFDPVHVGHLLVARDIMEKLGLDRMVFLPASRPPHKRCIASYVQRSRMLKAAIHGHAGFEASDAEAKRPGTSYTVESLAELKRTRPNDALFLIIGADQYQELATWKDPRRLPGLARLVVMSRPGAGMVKGIVPARRVAVRQIELSSTEIRKRIASGLDVSDMVPAPALRLIKRHRLYQSEKRAGPKRRQKGGK